MLNLFYDNCLDWNHNKNTTSVHYRRLALQRKVGVYCSLLENAAQKYTIQSDRFDERTHTLLTNGNF